MNKLQDILKYTKDLIDAEPNKSAYWHYTKLVGKIEEAIDVIHCSTQLKDKEAMTFEEYTNKFYTKTPEEYYVHKTAKHYEITKNDLQIEYTNYCLNF